MIQHKHNSFFEKKTLLKTICNSYTHTSILHINIYKYLPIKINMKTLSSKINILIKNNSFGHTGKKNKQIRK